MPQQARSLPLLCCATPQSHVSASPQTFFDSPKQVKDRSIFRVCVPSFSHGRPLFFGVCSFFCSTCCRVGSVCFFRFFDSVKQLLPSDLNSTRIRPWSSKGNGHANGRLMNGRSEEIHDWKSTMKKKCLLVRLLAHQFVISYVFSLQTSEVLWWKIPIWEEFVNCAIFIWCPFTMKIFSYC